MTKIFTILVCAILFSYSLNVFAQVNPNATPQAKALKAYFDATYGHKIISGQCDDSYLPYIKANTGGKEPAMIGYDFNGITPSGGGNTDAYKAIQWARRGGIVQFQWHWASPNGGGSSNWGPNDFNLANALADTTGSSYKNMMRDIDLVGNALKTLQDSGVAVLWRPLHEAEGGWFWWGASGQAACQTLWNLMYKHYTNDLHLNNLIWVWNSYGGTKLGNWYPGDNVVDIIGWDYETSSSWSSYQNLFGGKGKEFGLAEEGKLPDPNNFASKPWSYFLTWAYMVVDVDVDSRGQNTRSWLNTVYNDSKTVTLTDLPKSLIANAGPDYGVVTSATSAIVTLNGSATTDTKAAIVSYSWSENGVQIATGVKPSVTLGAGVHTVTLTVTDSQGATSTDVVLVTVKQPNVALNKQVYVSSTEANYGNIASKAVDGSLATRWSSVYADPQWIYVDLGTIYNISSVVLSWETASAKSYNIEVSNDATNWTLLSSKANMASGARVDYIALSASARYVRMSGLTRNTIYGYSLYEFEVNGSNAPFVAVTGITLTPSTESLVAGQTQQLAGAVLPSNATNKSITYTSSNTAVATVSAGGLVTAIGVGSAIITAQTVDGGFTAVSSVTVSPVAVTGVSVSPASISFVTLGQTQQLSVSVLPANASNKTVSYSTSNPAVATVSSTGLVTDVSNGTAVITVTTQDGGFTASASVLISNSSVPVGSTISLLANANGKYVSSWSSTANAPLLAKSTAANAWEQFLVVDAGNGHIALKATNNNMYVSAWQSETNAPLYARGTSVNGWEQFDWIVNGDGTISLKSLANGLYVSTWNTTDNPLQARGTSIGGWEKFNYSILKSAHISAVKQNDDAHKILVYPTVLSEGEVLNIQLADPSSEQTLIEIYNLSGKMIKQIVTTDTMVSLHIDSNFGTGMLVARITNGTDVYVNKIIIK